MCHQLHNWCPQIQLKNIKCLAAANETLLGGSPVHERTRWSHVHVARQPRCVLTAAADRTWTHTPEFCRSRGAGMKRTAKLHVDSLVRPVDPSFKIRLRHYLRWLHNTHFQQSCVVWAVESVRRWLRPQDWWF